MFVNKRYSLRNFFIFFIASIFLLQALSLPVYSLSEKQKRLYRLGINYYDIDQCSNLQTSGETSTVTSSDVKDLAQQMLENNNISYWTNNGVSTRDVVIALSEGKKAYTTSSAAPQKEVDINPNILKFILEAAEEGRVMVNALTDKEHSWPGSNHYKGLAVDLDSNPSNTTVSVDRLIAIANKYRGVKNNEAHHHFDFTKRPPKDANPTQNNSVYMVGDSISEGARDALTKEFESENLNLYLNSSVSRSISGPGITGEKSSGLQAIDNDKNRVKNAGRIIVSLGTNPESNFPAKVRDMIRKIKSHNSTAQIYWVNIFPTRPDLDKDGVNRTLDNLSSSENFQVIDTSEQGIQLSSDRVHPTPDGSKKFAKVVASGIEGETSTEGRESGQCRCGAGSETSLTGSNNEEKVWNYFIGKGLKPFQVAGIMGNMQQESGFNPQIIQGGGQTKDPSGITAGWGLIQWTPGSKILGIAKEAKIDGPIYELATQLDIVWWHMNNISPTGVQNMLEGFKKTTNWKEAADEFEDKVEGAGAPMMESRYAYAQEVLAKHGSGGGGEGSAPSACATNEVGQVVSEYSLPLPKRLYDRNKELFMQPHHTYPASDISVPEGTPVFSMTSGTIVTTTNDGNCGLGVIIKSDSGAEYTYCHASALGPVKSGKVKAGDRIMSSGNTGRSSGPHLHVQIRVDGSLRCPQKLFESIAEGNPVKESDLPTSGCVSGSS